MSEQAAGHELQHHEEQRHAVLADRCHRLVRFLREIALRQAPRITTLDDHPVVVWLDELPDGLSLFEQAGGDEVVLEAPAAATIPSPPALPDTLAGWVVMPEPGEPPEEFPPLREIRLLPRLERRPDGLRPQITETVRLVDSPDVRTAYEQWLPTWRIWAVRARADAARRALHNVLHGVVQRLAQEGDALELVLCTGLLSWQVPAPGTSGGPGTSNHDRPVMIVRHHLLATKLLVEVDAATSAIRLRLPAEAATRLEDGNLLDGVRTFRPERTNALHERLRGRRAVPLGLDDERVLRDWLTLAVDVSTDGYSPSWQPTAQPGPRPQVTFAPALVLRARGRAALLNYYDQMLDALRGAGRPPLGLVQLVETLETDERLAWLATGPVPSGTGLVSDPLFPLPANPEQARVMERLRHDNGVVVEGPPGTGKTHTIANLMSALLAQGQRVLVTSQKAQALRVLREKMPPALQRLCVSLTDVNETGSSELAASISALAAEKAAYHAEDHNRRIAQLRARRDAAAVREADLGEQVRRRRAAEGIRHGPDEVPSGWEGTTAQIARRVRDGRASHGWVPTPVPGVGVRRAGGTGGPPYVPLDAAETAELLAALRSRTPGRAGRLSQTTIDPGTVTPTDTIRELLAAEGAATAVVRAGEITLTEPAVVLADRLGGLASAQVDALHDAAAVLVDALDIVARHRVRWTWVDQALGDVLADHDTVLWTKVRSVSPAVGQAAGALERVGFHKVVLPTLTEQGPACPDTLRAGGRALQEHLAAGRGLRRVFRPKAQRDAALLLTGTSVDGVPPRTTELLDVVLARLTAEVALATAGRAWKLVGVDIDMDPATAPETRLARLHDLAGALDAVGRVRDARDRALDVTSSGSVTGMTLTDAQACRELAAVTDVVRLRRRAAAAAEDLRRIHSRYATAAREKAGPPELGMLAEALADCDLDAYEAARAALDAAVVEREVELRCSALLERIRAAHPELAVILADEVAVEPTGGPGPTATGPVDWDHRLGCFAEAWGWACAATWLADARTASGESDTDAELDAAEDAVAAATADLAGALAWKHCLDRMGAEQSAALRAYADAVAAGGKFTGRYAERYRQAAREAMGVAQTAVPAWVMPISEVLSTIPAVRDCFDVVIVDEGSQAGLDSLFLLWLAPRVIVVGDDRQCTPTGATFDELEPVFNRLDTLLPDVPGWLRVAFTPRSSLFTLLRTRFGEVIRLREHFRCMPEIIEWSSAMFYRDAPLVPLRQFGADRLPPLRSRHVPGAVTSGVAAGLRNPAESDALVAQVLACAEDPRYDGRSFGVVVLQGTAQAELIRGKLISRMSPAEQQRRRLRVGTPPDFQGDERDVVFLSMVVAPDTPTPSLTRLEYQRRFNVAASRARDQVWLFHSVTEDDLEPADLRHNYLSYIRSQVRATAGDYTGPDLPGPDLPVPGLPVPELTDVRPDIPHPRFDTLFEQRVFRILCGRGYRVRPQVEMNGRRIDLVVAGGRARLAVECDADTVASPEQIAHEFARERELRRAGWRFWRIRQSDFEIDPDAAMTSLWPMLADAGVTPVTTEAGTGRDPDIGTGLQPVGPGMEKSSGDAPDGAAARAALPSCGDQRRWTPIALSELEGLDDVPRNETLPADTLRSGTSPDNVPGGRTAPHRYGEDGTTPRPRPSDDGGAGSTTCAGNGSSS
ncbi:AAA domain-containing protein [Frankia sp. Cppng1_Ct_nod]|uniref:AAA domain-containing protein n=1 Tax=Frankia sp. Cppng1_Ct_nod TaxID=2897162 RepID=UPI00202418CA|nr:AAA domain-containing protein [Frankia sp. Cppng1_Ct_nod]